MTLGLSCTAAFPRRYSFIRHCARLSTSSLAENHLTLVLEREAQIVIFVCLMSHTRIGSLQVHGAGNAISWYHKHLVAT